MAAGDVPQCSRPVAAAMKASGRLRGRKSDVHSSADVDGGMGVVRAECLERLDMNIFLLQHTSCFAILMIHQRSLLKPPNAFPRFFPSQLSLHN